MSELLLDRLLGFGRALREEGVTAGTGQILEFCRASAALSPGDLYWVGRATLVSRRDEIETYDRIFHRYWRGDYGRPVTIEHAVERVKGVADDGLEGGESGRETSPSSLRASRLELLRSKSFAKLSSAELDELAQLMSDFRIAVPLRRSRRRRSAHRGDPDVRRTIRRSLRTGGEPIERAWRDRRRRRRRVVLILDVSGSMAAYSRGLLVFAHAALRSHQHCEAFCFGTRLTRVTHALAGSEPGEALDRAAESINDWDGGTRIGDSLKRFLDHFGHSGLARGAIVVICSDGLEMGDPQTLAEQMRRLSRLAHRVVWLNPLQEQAGYQPLARGMQAALPHVDTFASGHNLASLEALTRRLAAL